jgi:zinc D-Ala-D-Ala dipeptidase
MDKNGRRKRRPHDARLAVRYSLIFMLIGSLAGAALAQNRAGDPVEDRPASFVDTAAVVPGLIVEARYAGAHNFVGRPIDGYEAPRCLLTRPAANALAQVAGDLAAHDLKIKVFDCYRPTRAVSDFAHWARDLDDTLGKREFYPDVDKRTLFRDGYIASQSGHSRGSTLDLTLVNSEGQELDMGTPFDFFSPRSWPGAPNIGRSAEENRALLAAAMRRRGFRPYDKEWWHFTLADEPYPSTYFNFPVK